MNIHEEKEIIGKIINEDNNQSSKAGILTSFASSMARSYQQDVQMLPKMSEEDLDGYFQDNYDIIKVAYPDYIDDYDALEKKYNPGDYNPDQLNEGSTTKLYLLRDGGVFILKNTKNQSTDGVGCDTIEKILTDLGATDAHYGDKGPGELVRGVSKMMPSLIPIKVDSEKLRRSGISFKE